MTNLLRTLIPALLLAALSATATETDLQVRWDTTALADAASANNLSVFFAVGLTSGGGNASSLITLSEFDLGGGYPLNGFVVREGPGSAFGNMSEGIQLDDLNWFYAGVLQQFKPGDKLNFRLSISALDDGGTFPDSLDFALYTYNSDGIIVPLGTLDPQGGVVAFRTQLRSGTLTFETYASSYDPGRPGLSVAAPVIHAYGMPDPTAVPEPATVLYTGIGGALLMLGRWRGKRSRQ